MAEISRANLFGKLSPLAYKAIESATTFCKLRGNPYVEIVHWFHQILQFPDSDLHRIIRHFEQHAPARAGHDWSALEGGYASLWGTMSVIAADGGLVTATSVGWDPLAGLTKLDWVSDHTFRITECASGGAEGELVRFHPEDGTLERSGTTSWPVDEWHRMLAGRKRISLQAR